MTKLSSSETAVDLDLCGEKCPYTFLRTKLALERLPDGTTLAVRYDHTPARSSVPRALKSHGHLLVAEISEEDSRFILVIQKQGSQ